MDLSIAYALYFAARGRGNTAADEADPSAIYTTPARVLLSGLGADELFGGYTRHATALNRHGCQGLLDELELDVNRLGKRNLGRDDRVISHWGREARFPYLDESLVKWAVECPIWEKYGFSKDASDEMDVPEIEAGKKVLRLLAYNLGMKSVAQEKKRAVSNLLQPSRRLANLWKDTIRSTDGQNGSGQDEGYPVDLLIPKPDKASPWNLAMMTSQILLSYRCAFGLKRPSYLDVRFYL